MSRSSSKTASIILRARALQWKLIDAAAQVPGKNRSDFILKVACREAERVLLDQRLFNLDAEAFNMFRHPLEAPAEDNDALRALLTKKAPWS